MEHMQHINDFDKFLNEAFKKREKKDILKIKKEYLGAAYPEYFEEMLNVATKKDSYNDFVGYFLENILNADDFDKKDFAKYVKEMTADKKSGGDALLALSSLEQSLAAWKQIYKGKDLFKIWKKDQLESEVASWFSELEDSFKDGELDADDLLGLLDYIMNEDDLVVDGIMVRQYARKMGKEAMFDNMIKQIKSNNQNGATIKSIEDPLVKLKIMTIFGLGKSIKGTGTKAEKYKGFIEFTYKNKKYRFSTEDNDSNGKRLGMKGIARKISEVVGKENFANNSKRKTGNTNLFKLEPNKDTGKIDVVSTTTLSTADIKSIIHNVLVSLGERSKTINWTP
jgi:hypothetical protein